jgi:hypothetical protein
MRLLTSLFALVTISSTLVAQHSPRVGRALLLGAHLPFGRASHLATICDGSDIARVSRRRSIGKALVIGGLGGALVAPQLVTSPEGTAAINALAAGGAATAAGAYLYYGSRPSDGFWQSAYSQIKVGETREEDIGQCLGSPRATTSSGPEETWTYSTSSAGFLGMGGSAKSLSISFKVGRVSSLRKTEAGF